MTAIAHFVAITCYVGAAALAATPFARPVGAPVRGVLAVLGTGVLAHLVGLVAYARDVGQLPLTGLGPSLSVLGWRVPPGPRGLPRPGRTGPPGLFRVRWAAAFAPGARGGGLAPGGGFVAFAAPWPAPSLSRRMAPPLARSALAHQCSPMPPWRSVFVL
jgi:hypothetical protein